MTNIEEKSEQISYKYVVSVKFQNSRKAVLLQQISAHAM